MLGKRERERERERGREGGREGEREGERERDGEEGGLKSFAQNMLDPQNAMVDTEESCHKQKKGASSFFLPSVDS